MPSSRVKVGIALYSHRDLDGEERSPHWALVLHPQSYAAPNTLMYQILCPKSRWVLQHKMERLSNATDLHGQSLVGVLHVADVRGSVEVLDLFLSEFPPTISDDNPSGRFAWSSAAWVIRCLAHLESVGLLRLPCGPEALYNYTMSRFKMMKRRSMDEEGWVELPLVGPY